MRPAALSVGKSLAGEPAEVLTNFTPLAATRSTIRGSRMNRIGRLTPNGLRGSSFILAISARHLSTSPLDVSMMPSPPAWETAEASWLRAIQPIGAWTMGYFTPVWASTRFILVPLSSRQIAGALVGGGEIERRVGAAGQRALGIRLLDEGVAQAGRAPSLGDPPLGPGGGSGKGGG